MEQFHVVLQYYKVNNRKWKMDENFAFAVIETTGQRTSTTRVSVDISVDCWSRFMYNRRQNGICNSNL